MGVTLATHIRDKQSKITHPCLPLCPWPLLSDNTKLELRFPSGCTELSTKITLCIVLIAIMTLSFPAACLTRPFQHMDVIFFPDVLGEAKYGCYIVSQQLFSSLYKQKPLRFPRFDSSQSSIHISSLWWSNQPLNIGRSQTCWWFSCINARGC